MRCSRQLLFVLFASLGFAFSISTARAAITANGNVEPTTDPNLWTSSTDFSIGNIADGSLIVNGDSDLKSHSGDIGVSGAAKGVVTVSGSGSTWTTEYLNVGLFSNGLLNIKDGGAVSNNSVCEIGYGPGQAKGAVTVDGNGSSFTTGSLSVGDYGSGTLSITHRGSVNSTGCEIGRSDGYLTYPAATGVVTVDGYGSKWNVSIGYFGHSSIIVGGAGHGVLNITNGGAVSSDWDYIGYSSSLDPIHPTSGIGVVTVDGGRSTWTDSFLYVGNYGQGTLNITNSASVTTTYGSCIGYEDGSKGTVLVDGIGSKWTNGTLHIGGNGYDLLTKGQGALSITGGGYVKATSLYIEANSLLSIDVGKNSLLYVSGDTGIISNYGTIRVIAGANAIAGKNYYPISATGWTSGTSGTYQAIGGTWWRDPLYERFTASSIATVVSGEEVTLDLFSQQRMSATDSKVGGTGWTVGASFLASDVSKSLKVTASVIDQTALASLKTALAGTSDIVLGGWTFTTDAGYTDGDPAYLSFLIGDSYSRDDLRVWHFDGTSWTAYDATDLTCNDGYASFTVTSFSGYAVTAVPEPGMLMLMAAAGIALAAFARRKRA